jgi:prevent-host-death family protein
MGAQQVGIREIRQNLSKYLKRVEEGETFEVTDHGRPVATLGPVRRTHSPTLERLAAQGWAILGTGENLADMGEPIEISEGPTASEILDELREDRI